MSYGKNLVSKKELILETAKLTREEFWIQCEQYSAEGKKNEAETLLWCRCATDVELFANIFFPHYCVYPFNQLHRDVFDSTTFMERSIRRARAAPRGYAKSTIEAFIKPIHDACYGLETFLLIISNTQAQADQKLTDIRTEILTNAHLVDFYGVHFKNKRPGTTRYTIHGKEHKCLFASYGTGAEIRGVRFGPDRPSKIVADDMEHSEEVNNEELRKKYEDWFFQVISKVGNKFTNIHVVGTILHPESLLIGLTKNAAYESKIYKAVISFSTRQDLWNAWTKIYTDLDDTDRRAKAEAFYKQNESLMLEGTRVLWPEHETYMDLMKEMVETGRRAFFKEKQNEPLGSEESLFEQFHWYHEVSEGFFVEKPGHKDGGVLIPWEQLKDGEGKWLNAFGALDPATGQTKAKVNKSGDYSCIVNGIHHPGSGRLFLHEDWTKRASPTKFIQQIFEFEETYGFSKFAIETNLYRELLLPNLQDERKRRQEKTKKEIKVPFYDVVQTENKEARIYTLEPKVTHGYIVFNRALSQTFMRMFEQFPKGDHDDAPDVTEIIWNLVKGRYKASAMSKDVMGGR